MNKKKQKHILFRFLRYAYQIYKPYFLIVILNCLVVAGITIYNSYSLSILIYYLENSEYKTCLIVGLIIVGVNFVFYFLNKLITRLMEVSKEKIMHNFDVKIAEKLTKIPYQYLEDPYYLDLKEKAKVGVYNMGAIYTLITHFASIIQNTVTIIGLAAIMLMFDYKIVIVLVTAIVLNFILLLLSLKMQIKFFRELIPINRKYEYYLDTLLDTKNGKDFRMYSIKDLMDYKFKDFNHITLDYFTNLEIKASFLNSLIQIINYVEMGFIYALVAIKTLTERLSVSNFSLYIATAISFSTSVNTIIDDGMAIIRSIQYVEPLLELLDIKDENKIGKNIKIDRDIESIEFRNISFKYPRSETLIIKNLSFKINKGEKISIVGLNGAGKTTLVKLICRLYYPTSGDILINGRSIYDYEYDSYIHKVSAVFQDYKLFAYTLKENILNSDGDSKEAYDIACKVGLKDKIDSLPNGINSLYTKSYDEGGIELSGGEAQKIAIARALHANSSLVILDEPTSALDPLAEADIYQNFNDLVKDKTAIYISHRMSSSVFCDRILVLNNGMLEDFDSHKNLMKKTESLYYKMFMAQAINYAK